MNSKKACSLMAKFQFHIGAIRRSSKGPQSTTNTKFQFHIGAIRSCFAFSEPSNTVWRFNSILVQLEVTS